MRIAVIADTHDRFPPFLFDELKSADEIWHLGDVCNDDILAEIESLGRPVYLVRGNCDNNFHWPLTRLLQREGLRFFLIHIPPQRAPAGCDFLLHGHTHVPRDEMVDGVRFLNPGCITRPNRGAPASFAFLDIENGRAEWTLHLLAKKA